MNKEFPPFFHPIIFQTTYLPIIIIQSTQEYPAFRTEAKDHIAIRYNIIIIICINWLNTKTI